ncbi:tetratricopeptide repeat protein [Streptomyces longispororuber]|uniref:tetratricopeptide repeat protein n=1 Tax=Streptomyces longispororuber TaxID=68230 RepID=UPI00210EF3DF|nr:tetratricopeptide repeat protein [Streptomyces longispororuber]MCQ4206977.1 tetratricopeptide repeat protein [Streptomyces longispororuber]
MGEQNVSGGQQGHVVQARDIENLTITPPASSPEPGTADSPFLRYLRHPESWPVAREWQALPAGVHRARPGEDGSGLPPYVPRDADGQVRHHLRTAAAWGGMTLLVGDSTAGKTRTAFEALRAVFPHHRVLAPPAGGGKLWQVAEAAHGGGQPCVLWLDDLERYLGPDGLEPVVLEELGRSKVPVLATMRSKPFQNLRTGPSQQVLNVAEIVDLGRLWSESELSRAAECPDPRIADALAHHDLYGVAEYLAAGPALLREWRQAWSADGHARGAALVAAAVDLSRCGLPGPYSTELLTEVHERHLRDANGSYLRPEPLAAAFDWATRVRHGVTSMLLPADDGLWEPFDYLVDHAGPGVPDWLWDAALTHARDDTDRFVIGLHAYGVRPQAAETAWRQVHDHGHLLGTYNLAVLLADAGHTDEAEALYRQAHEKEYPRATNNLALLLRGQGKAAEAEALYRQAAARGYTKAAYNLGVLLEELGRTEEAEPLFRHMHDQGFRIATNNLANLRKQAGALDEAETLYRLAHEDGVVKATYNLALLLAGTDRTAEAEELYRVAHARGYKHATYNLALLLARQGRAEEAEAFFKHPHNQHNPNAVYNLAVLMQETGHPEEADRYYRRASAAGHPRATLGYADLAETTGRLDLAEKLYREAHAQGYVDATYRLARLLTTTGRTEEAEHCYELAHRGGHPEALVDLALLLIETGRSQPTDDPAGPDDGPT